MSKNQWGEPDANPEKGKFHVRHQIAAARDSGYMFGKNFDTLVEAIEFCEICIQRGLGWRLLIQATEEGWLKLENIKFEYYYVPIHKGEPSP